MIRVRDDDVLIGSSSHPDPLAEFKRVHKLICESSRLIHVPAILIHHNISTGSPGIVDFPGAVEFVQEKTDDGKMLPEVHGWQHIDYAKLSTAEVVDDLKRCQDFILKHFGRMATKWYTPWGANAPHLYEAANHVELELVDCSAINKLQGRYGVVKRLSDGKSIDYLEGDEIFMHWWQGGSHLRRVVEVLKHGTWAKAVEANEGNGLFEA